MATWGRHMWQETEGGLWLTAAKNGVLTLQSTKSQMLSTTTHARKQIPPQSRLE